MCVGTYVYNFQYTGIHGALQGLHGSQKQVCNKRGSMIHTYSQLFPACGLLSQSMWDSLRLAQTKLCMHAIGKLVMFCAVFLLHSLLEKILTCGS